MSNKITHSQPEDGFSIPGGGALHWRTVWPGQWTCDNAGYIWADSLKGGRTHMIDVRGWGYLTGRGSGALGLPSDVAGHIQDGLGALLCAAPDLLEAGVGLVEWADEICRTGKTPTFDAIWPMRAAIAKATGAEQ